MLVPVSSAVVNAETAESRTLGTVISIASVVLDRGIRWELMGVVKFDKLEPGVACGTESDGSPSGSMSRSKIAELDEWLS